ncbi:hypothetical protein MUG87_07645 [Ectobacillus sp. JY-23]|uniref:hypothetical protein n=1 Tax=Ectobacillus sp. JY-23 TaxID=2933872 RepID=UPI001FF2B63B|nr:hypothetical protein [Ectobacillus sp. JY-23]UOY93971.1 hypothetical protein MUG87_07645 [Ectobacillus sp. JY-23]
MSLKKKTEVRTGKMVRELMLADLDVTASLVMVYSESNVNKEIKVEGLNPRSNEELFISGDIDWNSSVIYKIVDFSGKVEVGKAILTEMKKNNLSLSIERIMWSKDKQGNIETAPEPTTPEPEATLTLVPEKAEPQPVTQTAETHQKAEKITVAKPVEATQAEEPRMQTVKNTSQAIPSQTPSAEWQERYSRLIAKAVSVCQDYELGMDVDDSISDLKGELEAQGVKVVPDKDILETVAQLRTLKSKGIDLHKILDLV